MISNYDKSFLRLVGRSPDLGEGWKQFSDVCWRLVDRFKTPELVEIDQENKRVRLTPEGDAVLRFAL